MKIKAAKYRDGKLVLDTSDRDVYRFVVGFKPGDYDIVPAKKKRSLDANAYAWVLIDKIASETGLTKTQVYRNAIKEVGGNTEIVCVRSDAVKQLCETWEKHGTGWIAEPFESGDAGYTNVKLMCGSSTFDTHQMSKFIDLLVQDATALEIETMPDYKLNAMMKHWKG